MTQVGGHKHSFLPISVKVRGCKNYIRQIIYIRKILSSPTKIKEGAKECFSNIYSESLTPRPTMGNVGFKKLSENHVAWLERDVTIEEVHLAIFSNESSKAPGPDNFNFNFYKKFRELMKHDLFIMVLELFRRGHLPKGINTSYIALIPKAFDTVSWSYLNDVIGYMKFGDQWRKWITTCVSTTRLSVLINGSLTSEFTASCGLWQGNPLFHLLFFFFFFIKCKNCIDQKVVGDQQYTEKGTESLN